MDIPPAYADLLDALIRELAEVPSVVVVAVAGSIADGTADEYSDLDLQVGVAERSSTLASPVREAVHRCLRIGDERWVVPGRIYSACGVDWRRVDVSLVATGTESFSHHAVAVYNPGELVLLRAPAPVVVPDPAALTRQVSRFLRSVGLIVRDLHRGDLRIGCFATEFLVDELITLMYQDRGIARGAQKGTYYQLPDEDVTALQSLPVATPNKHSIAEAHTAIANAYLRRARALASRWGAEWPVEMEEGTRDFLVRELGVALA